MSTRDTLITLYGTKVAETARAVRFVIKSIGETAISTHLSVWFPLSQVQKIVTSQDEAGRDMLMVSEWIMKEKGLLEAVKKATDPRHPPPHEDDSDDCYDQGDMPPWD